MRLRSVPPQLQSQVYEFFEYVHRTGALRPDALMHQLPPSLTVQLEMALKANLLLQNPMFENISQGATAALVRRLSTTVVVPDQVIICAGYPGECMYFVQSGNLVYFEEVSGLVQIFDAIDNVLAIGILVLGNKSKVNQSKFMEVHFVDYLSRGDKTISF